VRSDGILLFSVGSKSWGREQEFGLSHLVRIKVTSSKELHARRLEKGIMTEGKSRKIIQARGKKRRDAKLTSSRRTFSVCQSSAKEEG
jgi:hypothetical protein